MAKGGGADWGAGTAESADAYDEARAAPRYALPCPIIPFSGGAHACHDARFDGDRLKT